MKRGKKVEGGNGFRESTSNRLQSFEHVKKKGRHVSAKEQGGGGGLKERKRGGRIQRGTITGNDERLETGAKRINGIGDKDDKGTEDSQPMQLCSSKQWCRGVGEKKQVESRQGRRNWNRMDPTVGKHRP